MYEQRFPTSLLTVFVFPPGVQRETVYVVVGKQYERRDKPVTDQTVSSAKLGQSGQEYGTY